MQCLWAVNITLSFSIMGNFFLLIYRPRWFHYLVQAVLYGLGIVAVYVVYAIYPFIFESVKINNGIKAALITGMAGLATALIIAFIRFIRAITHQTRRPKDIVEPTTELPQL
jgi:hypothetical protein